MIALPGECLGLEAVVLEEVHTHGSPPVPEGWAHRDHAQYKTGAHPVCKATFQLEKKAPEVEVAWNTHLAGAEQMRMRQQSSVTQGFLARGCREAPRRQDPLAGGRRRCPQSVEPARSPAPSGCPRLSRQRSLDPPFPFWPSGRGSCQAATAPSMHISETGDGASPPQTPRDTWRILIMKCTC